MIGWILLAGAASLIYFGSGGAPNRKTISNISRGQLLSEGLRLDGPDGQPVITFTYNELSNSLDLWAKNVIQYLLDNLDQSTLEIYVFQSAQPHKEALKRALRQVTTPPDWRITFRNE